MVLYYLYFSCHLRTSGPIAELSDSGDPKTILNIPQRELDINPGLIQNPGY